MIAHNPLHGSGQAGFPHPALALGEDAYASQGIGMADGRQRQPANDEAPHASPKDAAFLAAPRKRAMPKPSYLESKKRRRRVVHGHSVISDVSTHHRLQPLAYFGNGCMHAPLKFGFHRVQLRLQPFANRLPQHREPSIAPLLHADVRKAKEVERLRFPFSTPPPLVDRKRVLLWQVPFGQATSLHLLRHRLPGFVRRLLRYYWSRRLPRFVRHRRTSLDFPTRPKATVALGEHGISRFPSAVSAYVHGVSDRAGLWHTSRYRCTRWGLPLLLTASASRSKSLTRLNTRPARPPVNASTLPLRAAPHDSGPMWVADPLSYDFCIHYTSPVLTGAQGEGL
jgi:hypothetical protein